MPTFAPVLASQLRRDPGRPLVTFYDHLTGERVELSVTTYANWVAKAASLLVEEGDLERGMRLRLDLPPHWLSTVFLGAAWTIGLVVTAEDDADAVVCGPDTVSDWAERDSGHPVFACSLRPLGGRFTDPLPAGVHDVGVEVWSQPDAFTPWDPPSDDDPATDHLTAGEVMAARVEAARPTGDRPQEAAPSNEAGAAGSGLTDGARLLSVADPASPPGTATFTEPLARGGSLVLVRNPDPNLLDAVVEAERVTHRL